jgi:hypothetical protein
MMMVMMAIPLDFLSACFSLRQAEAALSLDCARPVEQLGKASKDV